MNKPTKEEMRESILDAVMVKAIPDEMADAIIALIESSPEAGEQQEDGYIEHLKAEQKRAIEDCAVPEKFLKPAPLPAEVEAAMERLGRCIGAAFSRRADLLFMARPGADHERDKDNAALATIRAALTEARQPKVVSREWVARFARAENAYDWFGVGQLLGELGLTVEEPK